MGGRGGGSGRGVGMGGGAADSTRQGMLANIVRE